MMKLLGSALLTLILGFGTNAQEIELNWIVTVDTGGLNRATDMFLDNDNNPIIVGQIPQLTDVDPGDAEILVGTAGPYYSYTSGLVQKFDGENGDMMWYGLSGGFGWDSNFISDMDQDEDGNLYVFGLCSGPGMHDFDPGDGEYLYDPWDAQMPYVLKLDSDRNLIWTYFIDFYESDGMDYIPGPPSGWGWSGEIEVSPVDGSIDLTGHFYGEMDCYAGPENEFWISAPSEGTPYHIKLDNDGVFMSAYSNADLSEFTHNWPLSKDQGTGAYCAGYFSGTADLDPGVGVDSRTSAGLADIYLQHLTVDGEIDWTKTIGGTSTDRPKDIHVDEDKNIFLSGDFSGIVDFDPGPGTFEMGLASPFNSTFLAKYDSLGNFIWGLSWYKSYSRAFTIAPTGEIYVVIQGLEGTDLDPGPDEVLDGEYDQFAIIKLDDMGSYIWSENMDVRNLEGCKIAATDEGTIFLSGWFVGDNDFDGSEVPSDFDPDPSATLDYFSDYGFGGFGVGTLFCIRYDEVCASPTEVNLDAIAICEGDSVLIFDNYENEAGIYTATYTDMAGCDSLVNQPLSIIVFDDLAISEVDLILECSIIGASYQWVNCDEDYSEIDGATEQTYGPDLNGVNYAVIVTVGSCTDTSDCFYYEWGGIHDEALNFLDVSPNPNNGEFTLSFGNNAGFNEVQITITDINGQVIRQFTTTENLLNIQLTGQDSGVYLIRLQSETETRVRRFVID